MFPVMVDTSVHMRAYDEGIMRHHLTHCRFVLNPKQSVTLMAILKMGFFP